MLLLMSSFCGCSYHVILLMNKIPFFCQEIIATYSLWLYTIRGFSIASEEYKKEATGSSKTKGPETI